MQDLSQIRLGLGLIGKSAVYVSLSRKGHFRVAGHFYQFRDCPGQSGTCGHPRRKGSGGEEEELGNHPFGGGGWGRVTVRPNPN